MSPLRPPNQTSFWNYLCEKGKLTKGVLINVWGKFALASVCAEKLKFDAKSHNIQRNYIVGANCWGGVEGISPSLLLISPLWSFSLYPRQGYILFPLLVRLQVDNNRGCFKKTFRIQNASGLNSHIVAVVMMTALHAWNDTKSNSIICSS